MNDAKAFFDTNILLYMYGNDEAKQRRALALFEDHVRSDRLVISTQVVQEFYAAGQRKLQIGKAALRAFTLRLLELPLITIQHSHIRAALNLEERYGISFWDALIVAAAESGRADILYTEDLNNGQRYGTVVACNPFAS